MKLGRLLAIFLLVLWPLGVARAQSSFPMLMSLDPAAAQVGQASRHTLHSRYDLRDTYQVLVTGSGVTGEWIPPEADTENGSEKPKPLEKAEIRFTVSPDALPGVRDFRLLTPRGASTLGQLVVVRDPVIAEADDNNTPEGAQPITLPATLCGRLERNEDVDYFKFEAAAGSALTFHVRSMRLEDKIHDLQSHVDPILTLRDPSGATLAVSDNYYAADPLLAHQFEQSGEYLLEIRDVRYKGNQYWTYSIEIDERPFVTHVHPLGVNPEQEASLQLVGFHQPEDSVALLTAGAVSALGPQRLRLPLGDEVTNPVPVVVSDLPRSVETDSENGTPAAAEMVPVPSGISGRIQSAGDVDCFTFEARQGEQFSAEVIAARVESPLDSYLRIVDADGKPLDENDDVQIGPRTYADSRIENWTAPADGKYTLEIRDLHWRGGAEFVYFIQLTRGRPGFELFLDTDKTQLTPGTGAVIFVRARRTSGFDREIQLHVDGLPPGVTAACGRILRSPDKDSPHGRDGCIILQADSNAAVSYSNIKITGTPIGPAEACDAAPVVATPFQETYQPGGRRVHWPVEMHTVAVGGPSDIREVKLSPGEVTLRPGESQRIDVEIVRAPGFDKNVTLEVVFQHLSDIFGNTLPPGVTLEGNESLTLLGGGTSQGHLVLKAAADTPPVEKQQVAVMAHVSLNFAMQTIYAGPPLGLSVAVKDE